MPLPVLRCHVRADRHCIYAVYVSGSGRPGGRRSAGPLFCLAADEIADISFAAAFEKLQLFLQKLLEGFITQKEEICALDFLTGLPDDMKRFLDFEGLMDTSMPEMGCEV